MSCRRAAARCPSPDGERSRPEPLDAKARSRRRPEHHVLGQLLLARPARGPAPPPGAAVTRQDDVPQQLARQLLQPGAGRARGGDHRHVGAESALPLRDRLGRALLGHEVGLGERQHARQPRRAARRARRAPARSSRGWPRRLRPRPRRAPARCPARARAGACAPRAPGSRARGRPPSLAPSIKPGMSASTSWRSSPSRTPSTGESVVNG